MDAVHAPGRSRLKMAAALSVAALAATCGIVATAAPSHAVAATVNTAQELIDAVGAASVSADTDHVITLGADITWESSWLSYTGTGNFTLDGAGHTVTVAGAANGFFTIYEPTHVVGVTILDLTVTGDASSSVLDINAGDIVLKDVAVTGFSTQYTPVVLRGATVEVEDSSFTGNSSQEQGGGALVIAGDTSPDTSAFIRDSYFAGNQTLADDGGAVLADSNIEINGSTFEGNTSAQHGGAVAVTNGAVHISDSAFTDNSAAMNGGAVYARDFEAVSDHTSYVDNEASDDGGAVWALSYTDSFQSLYSGNEAGLLGGAIYTGGNDYSYYWNSTFDANASGSFGGAVYAANSYIEEYHSTFTGNQANLGGGHVWVEAGSLYSYASVYSGHSGATGCYADDVVDSWGYNFDQDGSCTNNREEAGDFGAATDPGLGALAYNGGPTQTRLPSATSVLIDHVPAGVCSTWIDSEGDDLDSDQRGVYRSGVLDNGDEGCDTGAVEVIPDLVYTYYDDDSNLIATATISNAVDWDCGATYTLAELGGTPPAGIAFPYGGFDFCILLPDLGWSSTVTWVFPAPVNQMWKIDEGLWTRITTAAFAGTSVTYTITDGDALDTDGVVDGVIYDPAAPGIGASFTG